MQLHVLFVQRACSYPGQYAPEAIEVCDENTMSDNPEWLNTKLAEARKNSEFTAAEIVVVTLTPDAEKLIHYRLNGSLEVPGSVSSDE